MYNFTSIQELQDLIRTNGTRDHFCLNNVIYTMDDYDMGGKIVAYGNKRTSTCLQVETQDRYKSFGDAVVTVSDAMFFRNDINYVD